MGERTVGPVNDELWRSLLSKFGGVIRVAVGQAYTKMLQGVVLDPACGLTWLIHARRMNVGYGSGGGRGGGVDQLL